MRSFRWSVLLACSAIGAGACVPIPADVSSTFAPVQPGEPSNYHRRGGAAQAAPPSSAGVGTADAGAPPVAPTSTATALEGTKP